MCFFYISLPIFAETHELITFKHIHDLCVSNFFNVFFSCSFCLNSFNFLFSCLLCFKFQISSFSIYIPNPLILLLSFRTKFPLSLSPPFNDTSSLSMTPSPLPSLKHYLEVRRLEQLVQIRKHRKELAQAMRVIYSTCQLYRTM